VTLDNNDHIARYAMTHRRLSNISMKMNILFISRAYPPTIGGIEKQNYEIAQGLAKISNLYLIANRKGKRALPLFIPYALCKAVLTARKYDVVLLGDGVLGVVGYFLKLFSTVSIACIVHGLDLTFKNRLYQKLWIGIFMQRIDRLIAVGKETIHQGVLRGIPATKFVFIPNGVSIPDPLPVYSRKDLESFIGRGIQGGILLTLGRLVKRKGVAWFIAEVVSHLDDNIIYIIAGEGKERSTIESVIRTNRLEHRVICLGAVTEHEKSLLLSTANIFVQPNISVVDDMEGFGLVVLEAAAYGMTTIATDLEGLKDAIKDGQNGYLIAEADADGYVRKIQSLLGNPELLKTIGFQARNYVSEHNAWSHIASDYLEVLASLISRF
jgi:glycosyltransferase involved in cell wall biosynthesis